MNLIGYDTSSLTALFLVSRGSLGQLPLARVAGELIQRYSFAGFPTNIEQLEAEKVEFRQGTFGDTGIESFSVYSDGVVITSKSSTDILNDFLTDVIQWAESSFGLKKIPTHSPSIAYESRVLV